MPNRREHIDKAHHNESFFASLGIDKTVFLDWVVNGIFYSAVHYVDSYLATKGENPGEHRERIRFIKNEADLGNPVFHDYMSLKDDSEGGRYNMKSFTPDEIKRDILPRLEKIKTHLRQYIPEI